jgi:hypothetical protein
VGGFEYGDEPDSSLRGRVLLDWLSSYEFIKKDTFMWSWEGTAC